MTRTALLVLLALTGCIFGSSGLDADGDGAMSDVDCDDGDATVFPRAPELCDGVDNDCDEIVDDSVEEAPTWYMDADQDGFGAASSALTACVAPQGAVTNGADCDDTDPALHPAAVEDCNGLDDDCDGTVDDDLPTAWYLDADGDGYGVDTQPGPTTCEAPEGYAARGGDCDDVRVDVHPMAPETACGFDATDYNCDGSVGYADLDGDGVAACAGDCDDGDPLRSPSLPERCDDADADEDCDGAADDLDEGGALDTSPWALDADGDGFGGATHIDACDAAVGRLPVDTAVDCDDTDPLVSPAATEACDPARTDDDCDGYPDGLDPEGAAGMGTRWTDDDGDGHGDPAHPVYACGSDGGTASDRLDCDDSDSATYEGAPEAIADGVDQDCDGDEACYVDRDADGYGGSLTTSRDFSCAGAGLSPRGGDCDDTTSAVRPRATERVADGVDSDCDGFEICYADADLDGYGAVSSYVVSADVTCSAPGVSSNALDCDDVDGAVSPSARELPADGVDQNCDGAESCFVDGDRDGFGSTATTSSTSRSCTASGVSARADDCYDASGTSASVAARAYPGAAYTESGTACMEDKDADGWGDSTPSDGAITRGTDCHDSVASIHPGVALRDSATACMEDRDGDGWGDSTPSISGATAGTDCDDSSASDYPGATETVANGDDEDCDGVDSCYRDLDNDSFGTSTVVDGSSLDCVTGTGAAIATDCDDFSATDYPGATEIVANGDDEDCDGVDSCYQDLDDDNYGTTTVVDGSSLSCSSGSGAPVATDCLDDVPFVNPGEPETCDGYDTNCDGTLLACDDYIYY